MAASPLILGSQSPRRRALLARLGVPFVVRTVPVDEDQVTLADPAANVLARARLKAAVLAQTAGERVILTADTTVADGLEMLNKPADPAEAKAMLARLRGRPHQVHTAVVLWRPEGGEQVVRADVCTTDVWMRPYAEAEMAAYVATGDPLDKAGAYAIQDPTFRPVARLRGCYTGVVGLPLCRVAALLRADGVAPVAWPADDPPESWQGCDFCTSRLADRFSITS